MALIKDYEIQGTGVVVPNAYHVISDIKVNKRMAEIAPPPDSGTASGLTNDGVREPGTEVYYASGYVCRVWVTIFKDKAARDSNMDAIGYAGMNSTEVQANLSIGTPGLDHRCEFMLDMTSGESDLVQAYKHLKSLDFYEGCTED